MFNYILVLKGENKKFATLEFENQHLMLNKEKIKLKQLQNTIYYFKSNIDIKNSNPILERLTFTNYLGKIILKNKDLEKLKEEIRKENFSRLEKKTFAVRIKKARSEMKVDKAQKELARPIWESLKEPGVNLANPQFEFNFFFFENNKNIIFSEKIFENKKDYLKRMPKLRPVAKPYTLKSDMARGAINLLNVKEGNFLDPFCGIGGILLEAKDLNFNVYGNDISWNDLNLAKENFKHYFPKEKVNLSLADSKTQFLKENTIDGIVTDIPYGKCSRKLGADLYEEFLKSAKIYLKPGKRLIVIYANFVQFKKLALKYFKKVDEIDEFINKSMTRHILILENKSKIDNFELSPP